MPSVLRINRRWGIYRVILSARVVGFRLARKESSRSRYEIASECRLSGSDKSGTSATIYSDEDWRAVLTFVQFLRAPLVLFVVVKFSLSFSLFFFLKRESNRIDFKPKTFILNGINSGISIRFENNHNWQSDSFPASFNFNSNENFNDFQWKLKVCNFAN